MQQTIKYICIDDEYLDLLSIQDQANKFPTFKCAGAYSNVNDAFSAIQEIKPDVVFTDIDMPGINGIELVKLLRNYIPVAVLITNHPEYAIESYELSVLDYIIKPVTDDRFAFCVSRINDYIDNKWKAHAYEVSAESREIVIKDGSYKIKLLTTDIFYLEAMQDYTKVVTKEKKYMVNQSLSTFLTNIPTGDFVRIHRSYAVCKNHVKRLSTNEISGDYFKLPIGKTYKPVIAKLLL